MPRPEKRLGTVDPFLLDLRLNIKKLLPHSPRTGPPLLLLLTYPEAPLLRRSKFGRSPREFLPEAAALAATAAARMTASAHTAQTSDPSG